MAILSSIFLSHCLLQVTKGGMSKNRAFRLYSSSWKVTYGRVADDGSNMNNQVIVDVSYLLNASLPSVLSYR